MSFLNVLLLGGAAAFMAPLLIHLLHRSHFQTVSWGATHLLDAALENNTRRVQWASWLLLLIRCLIPVLLAVTLARPVLTHLQSTVADQDASLTLLIDNSLSMAAGGPGESLLTRAASELTNIARQAPGAKLELWSTASPIRHVLAEPTPDLPRLAASLQQIGPAAGVSWPGETLQLSSRLLSTSPAAGRQIILASDFQSALWSAVSENELQAIRNQLTAGRQSAQLFLLPLRTDGRSANVSVQWEDAPPTARLDQPYQTLVRVSNHGTEPAHDVDVTFQIDGRDLASRTLQLSAGASEQVPFACEFTARGWQSLAIRVNDRSSLRGDDECFHSVRVDAPPRVLIIDDSLPPAEVSAGSPHIGQRSFTGTSRFLSLALAPFEEPQQNPFLLTHARAKDLDSDTLAHHAVVIVAQLHASTSRLADDLAKYVDSGGSLLLFSPPATDSAVWQSLSETTPAWLPMRWGQPRAAASGQPVKLLLEGSESAVAPLQQALAHGTDSFNFTRWWELVSRAASPGVQTLSRLSSGDAWLVEQRVGRGVVVQCASGCADDGTNLPSQSAYVPVMHSLTERLVAHTARSAHLSTGQSVAFELLKSGQPDSAASEPISTRASKKLSVQRVFPAGDAAWSSMGPTRIWELPVQQGRAVFAETRLPGVYQAQWHAAEASQVTIEPALVSVNPPAIESQIGSLSRTEIQSLAARLGATLIESADDYVRSEKVRREGWEFWQWMLLAVLGLLFAELFIGLRGNPVGARGIS